MSVENNNTISALKSMYEAKLYRISAYIHTVLQPKLSKEEMAELQQRIFSTDDTADVHSDNNTDDSLLAVSQEGNLTNRNGQPIAKDPPRQQDANPFYNAKWSVWDKLYFFLVQTEEPLRVVDLVEKIIVQENINNDDTGLVRKLNVNVNATLSSKFLNNDDLIQRKKIKNEYHYSLANKDFIVPAGTTGM